MAAKLVFIHIEKAAGTSQRALLDRVYGRSNVLWRGRDFKDCRSGGLPDITKYLVIGGHLSAAQFQGVRTPILFLSIVREPVDRAVSLFHYFSENGPEKDRRDWRNKGLDPSSMTTTIQNVPAFRDAVSNRQCSRLSGNCDFVTTLDKLHNDNYLIGSFGRVEEFTNRVASLLDWPPVTPGRHNSARRSDYRDEILAEPGLRDLIGNLNQEDEKLYRFIANQGCFEHLPEVGVLKRNLSVGTEELPGVCK